MTRVFYQLWDELLSEMIDLCEEMKVILHKCSCIYMHVMTLNKYFRTCHHRQVMVSVRLVMMTVTPILNQCMSH